MKNALAENCNVMKTQFNLINNINSLKLWIFYNLPSSVNQKLQPWAIRWMWHGFMWSQIGDSNAPDLQDAQFPPRNRPQIMPAANNFPKSWNFSTKLPWVRTPRKKEPMEPMTLLRGFLDPPMQIGRVDQEEGQYTGGGQQKGTEWWLLPSIIILSNPESFSPQMRQLYHMGMPLISIYIVWVRQH